MRSCPSSGTRHLNYIKKELSIHSRIGQCKKNAIFLFRCQSAKPLRKTPVYCTTAVITKTGFCDKILAFAPAGGCRFYGFFWLFPRFCYHALTSHYCISHLYFRLYILQRGNRYFLKRYLVRNKRLALVLLVPSKPAEIFPG